MVRKGRELKKVREEKEALGCMLQPQVVAALGVGVDVDVHVRVDADEVVVVVVAVVVVVVVAAAALIETVDIVVGS